MAKQRTGTMRERQPGVWQLAITEAGQRRYVTFHGTKGEAKDHLMALQVVGGEPAIGTISSMLADWMRMERHRWKTATLVKYEGMVRQHIAPFIGERSMTGFTKVDGKAFYATLRENGRTENTVGMAHKVLSMAFTSVVDDDALDRNPVDRVKMVKVKVREVVPPRETQVEDMLELARESGLWWYPALRLAAYTGMRRGEVMGLLWTNVNLPREFLDVCQSLTHVRGQLRMETPKSDSSNRRVELDATTVAILTEHKRAQEAHKVAMGKDYVDQLIVFSKPDGGYFNPGAFSETVSTLSKRTGPRMKGHALRHYHASVWLHRNASFHRVYLYSHYPRHGLTQ